MPGPSRHPTQPSVRRRRRRRLALLAGPLLAALVPAITTAHPLGNFTINHYSGLSVMPDRILVDQVLDLAEVPAFQALQATGGGFGPSGPDAFARDRCTALARSLRLAVDGIDQALELTTATASLPPGQGGLATLRLECGYEAVLSVPFGTPTSIAFSDAAYAERIGWREMSVEGTGVRVEAPDIPTASISARLTRYPDDRLAGPPAVAAISFDVRPLVGKVEPEIDPVAAPEAGPVAAPEADRAPEPEAHGAPGSEASMPPARLPGTIARPQAADGGVPTANVGGAVPGGIDALPAELAQVVDGRATTPAILVLGLVVAVGLGAFHALTPGHGKTIMAAYLVGTRGDVPRALGLGVTVAVSHTIGVLILALIVLAASSVLPAERLFPVLSLVSGALVAGLGAWLLVSALQRLRSMRVHDRSPAGTHDGHEHGHPHDHDHPHDDGWHEHGGMRHRHVPIGTSDQPIRWLGILTLGLAGGLIPSTSAVLLLLAAVASGRPALGVILVVAFGLGMAVVLGAIGVLLVWARGLLERLPTGARDGRLTLAVSLAAATLVLGLGLLLTSQSLAALSG